MPARYDIDNLNGRPPRPDEADVTQHLRPDWNRGYRGGERRRMFAPVGEEAARLAREARLILGAEWLPDGRVAIYGRHPHEPEESERVRLATNGPGPDEPAAVLRRLILDLCNEPPRCAP